MFYKSKVDFFILDAATLNLPERGWFADSYGRAYAHVRKEKNDLIKRLKSRGLNPIEAAAVLSLWLANKEIENSTGNNIADFLRSAHNSLMVNKKYEKTEDHYGTKKFNKVNDALDAEGIKSPDK